MEKNNTVEDMFGEDYLELIHKAMVDEVADTPELKEEYDEICYIINNGTITDLELVKIFDILPYEIATTIFEELKNRDCEELLRLYNSMIYDEFVMSTRPFGKNNLTQFEKRFMDQTESTALRSRLLTRYELEALIDIVAKKEGLKDASYSVTHGDYNGEHKYLKLLIKAHKVLTNNRNMNKRFAIMKKIKPTLFTWMIKELKQHENILEN